VPSMTVAKRATSKLKLYRVFRSIPENRSIPLHDIALPRIGRVCRSLPFIATMDRRRRTVQFPEDLRLLHDVLERSELAGRYWVWSGLLLGWAREGQILAHDMQDADFAYLAEDEDRFQRTVPLLLEAGFRRWFSFRNNAGQVTEHVLTRRGAHVDFFQMREVGEQWEYFVYGVDERGPVELVGRLPRQRLEEFQFLGRSWLKVRDHDLELATIYGAWKVPDKTWSFLDDGGIVGRCPWTKQGRVPPRLRGVATRRAGAERTSTGDTSSVQWIRI